MRRNNHSKFGRRSIRLGLTCWIGAALLVPFTTIRVEAQRVPCGAVGQRACGSGDDFYDVHYNQPDFHVTELPPFWFNNAECDLALVNDNGACRNVDVPSAFTGGMRHIIGTFANTHWIDWAMKQQRIIQADQAMNWTTVFGTHNSFSNYQDGAFDVEVPSIPRMNLNVDQQWSISDQLDAGARIIRLDPVSYNVHYGNVTHPSGSNDRQLRMCHQSGSGLTTDLECDFTSYGRLFAYGVAEVREWLTKNPGEILVLRLNRTQAGDMDLIDEALETNLINPDGSDPILHPPYNAGQTIPWAVTWDPTTQGWPTLRQMRDMKARIIIFSDNGSFSTYPWKWVMNDGYTDAPGFNNCLNQASADQGNVGVDMRTRPFNMWSYIGEDRSGSNALQTIDPNLGGAGLLDDSAVTTANTCGFGLINVDFLLAGFKSPSQSWSITASIPDTSYSFTLPAYDNTFPDPDKRREAAIWSWDENENGEGQNAFLKPNGRWGSSLSVHARPFACALGQGKAKNPANYTWVISAANGMWTSGVQACQAVGGVFWAPQSALENQRLVAAAHSQEVWINYAATDQIILEPASAGLDFTPGSFSSFVINVTQGGSDAALLNPTLRYTGGIGGSLSVSLFTPQTQIISKFLHVDSLTKTIQLHELGTGITDHHHQITLAPGSYTQVFSVTESIENFPQRVNLFTLNIHVAPAPKVVNVTVDSIPSGQVIYVDNAKVRAPQTFSWVPGNVHTLNAGLTVNPVGEKLAFLGWSNGATTAAFNFKVPQTDADIAARFADYYLLTVKTAGSGTVSAVPGSPDGYYLRGTNVTLTANPATNYYVKGFSGEFKSDQTQISFAMEKPLSLLAEFVADPITSIRTAGLYVPLPAIVDGVPVNLPSDFRWAPGTKHTIAFDSPFSPQGGGVQFLFSKWSDGMTTASRTVTASVAPQPLTADFIKQFFVTTSSQPAEGGTVTGQGWYTAGSNATFTAIAAPGYQFLGFNGNPALTSPLTVKITAPAIEYAYFK